MSLLFPDLMLLVTHNSKKDCFHLSGFKPEGLTDGSAEEKFDSLKKQLHGFLLAIKPTARFEVADYFS
jgi:hypothetical protein